MYGTPEMQALDDRVRDLRATLEDDIDVLKRAGERAMLTKRELAEARKALDAARHNAMAAAIGLPQDSDPTNVPVGDDAA